ncbi:MAG: hypothetical protein JRG91_07045 [Deltaproteobacteria bacterium]|nr:hypothetical protein [Deltaproteobacteria bacterium]
MAAALIVFAGCDQDYPTVPPDSGTEIPGEDVVVETPIPDAEPEPMDDPVEETAPCTYPSGPYSFSMVGSIAGPMSWPSAISGSEETLPADFAVLQCDESVQSIIVLIATLS